VPKLDLVSCAKDELEALPNIHLLLRDELKKKPIISVHQCPKSDLSETTFNRKSETSSGTLKNVPSPSEER